MPLLFLAGLFLVGIVVFMISFYTYDSIERHTAGNAKWVSEKLDQMFMPISAKYTYRLLLISPFALGGMIFFLCWPHLFWSLSLGTFVALLGFRLPKPLLQIFIQRRIRKLNLQMVDGLTLMANALRSGLSLMQALQIVVDEMPDPLSQEIGLILSEQRVGVPVEKAFQNFSDRINTEDTEMFVTSVIVLRETGGNLAETFETIVHTIRERLKLENKISALTTQGVLKGTIITLMPFALMLLLYMIDPSHMMPLFTTIPGYVMLILMLTLQSLGGFMIKKIVTIRI